MKALILSFLLALPLCISAKVTYEATLGAVIETLSECDRALVKLRSSSMKREDLHEFEIRLQYSTEAYGGYSNNAPNDQIKETLMVISRLHFDSASTLFKAIGSGKKGEKAFRSCDKRLKTLPSLVLGILLGLVDEESKEIRMSSQDISSVISRLEKTFGDRLVDDPELAKDNPFLQSASMIHVFLGENLTKVEQK